MSIRAKRALTCSGLLIAAGALLASGPTVAWAGFVGGSAVGGVYINGDGVLDAPHVEALQELQEARKTALKPIAGDLDEFTELRKISLRRLEEAIQKHRATKFTDLPDEIRFLGGLQQIRYVFVYPDEQDIVLVGPAEGWKVDELGNVIGKTTGRPVMALDDVLVALRTAAGARHRLKR